MLLTDLPNIQNIDLYEKAGDLYAKLSRFMDAALCYRKSKVWYKAGVNFEKAKMYDDAALSYKDGAFYREVTNLIQR
jgi:hypothetical protein